jgi:hypothetical protein
MRCMRLMKPTRMFAGLLAGLLFAILGVPLCAQAAPECSAGRGFGPGYDALHEITLNGTIQEVKETQRWPSLAGLACA